MIKIDIVSGFLGAGKTTYIKKMVQEVFLHEKVVIIENEFGDIEIDSTILEKAGIITHPMQSGCICCSLTGDFKEALSLVVETYHPERIIIEPSGVGKLSQVLNTVNQLKDLKNITLNPPTTIIDSLKYFLHVKNFGAFYLDQLHYSQRLVLSKTQHANREHINQIIFDLKQRNPKGTIFTDDWQAINFSDYINFSNEKLAEKPFKKILRGSKGVSSVKKSINLSAEEVFDSWSCQFDYWWDLKQVQSLIELIKESDYFGQVVRAKGFFQISATDWVKIDYVDGESNIEDTKSLGTSRVIVIGVGLKKENLKAHFDSIEGDNENKS